MAGSGGRYPPHFKERVVELVRAGRSPGSLAQEFEPSEQTVGTGSSRRTWTRAAAATG